MSPDPKISCGPYRPLKERNDLYLRFNPDVDAMNHDTIGMVVIGADHKVVAGTSTNGANNKIAG